MTERPLILFPSPEESERAKGTGFPSSFHKPSISRQYERLSPKFTELQTAIQHKTILVQQSPIGLNPELALVFEVIGSVDSFLTAVRRVDGLEWLFDIPLDNIEGNDDFYSLNDENERTEDVLSGKLYCVMSNQAAITQLLSLWQRYSRDEHMSFDRGYSGLRDVFIHLKDIRLWNAIDRINETHSIEYWRERLQIDGENEVKFEIELFFRNSSDKRSNASNTIRRAISDLNGRVVDECIIDGICYHCILAALPRTQIENLVNNYEEVNIVKVDDIMFFRPVGQIIYNTNNESAQIDSSLIQDITQTGEPIAAIFDGFPMQNHDLLAGKLIIDDPDNWANGYIVKDRIHGTAMASLVLYGDLSDRNSVLTRKVYIRPILRPNSFVDNTYEEIPNNIILVDLIHRSVKRLFEGEGEVPEVAPTVKIINLSLGDRYRPYINIMSPLARLLDWLSFKYKVLFIISAGNHNLDGIDLGETFENFARLPIYEREKAVLEMMEQQSRLTRLLSPSESINALTIGATFDDSSSVEENERQILPLVNKLTSPISAIGLGHNRAIKPDLFYKGGRKFLFERYGGTKMMWTTSTRPPGSLVALPCPDGTASGTGYTFGTSDSAAQITHLGAKGYEILDEIFRQETGDPIPNNYSAILIKAMLAHGASWDNIASVIASVLGDSQKRVQKWLGNGIPNMSRVEQCARNRVTLIGYGSLAKEKAHVYQLPLPFEFSQRIFRRLTVTLAYFTPIVPTVQKYRSAQLWFTLNNSDIVPNRQNTDWRAVCRGTLQHEIFTGGEAKYWNIEEPLEIKVNCKQDANNLTVPIEYGLFVTFEVAEGVDMDIYTGVTTSIRTRVSVTANT